ncbi:HEAT repeat domain-containing protein [Myroides sp. WP-1]|uniref:HEAT repeat domain-containing protein n=1 Tax=Myroides sp. WP-1 TaxID=2759944 RepID=UPI0015FDD47E|nr:HEAT repeat domain-containing protein [Myroides sp. WP-1]MBB1139577.1 HEAT repeat domain-containing protein [Myroides sp. WP-1]
MVDFWKFYKGLLKRTDYFDKYWDRFPYDQRHRFQFNEETLSLLKDHITNKNDKGLASILALICNNGADKDYTDLLLQLLDENWHTSEEDIISVLELIKDPRSVNKLYEVAINVPDYDEMRALAKKCMWALSAINTQEAIQKLELLQNCDDLILRENATFQLEQVLKKN